MKSMLSSTTVVLGSSDLHSVAIAQTELWNILQEHLVSMCICTSVQLQGVDSCGTVFPVYTVPGFLLLAACSFPPILCLPQDFLNGVCTHVIWLTKQKLTYYTGNYDTFVKTVRENEVIQQKKYEKEQDDIKHLKAFIASCGKSNSVALTLLHLVLQSPA